jgi:hypothetical protein
MHSCCALFPFTQYSYRWGETPAEFTAPTLEVTSHQGGIHLLRRLLGQSQPSLAFWYAGFFGIAFVQLFWIFEGCLLDYQKAPLAAAAGTQPGRRESGAEKNTGGGGGGGLINSGRRTFVPNVLGRDPRPPLRPTDDGPTRTIDTARTLFAKSQTHPPTCRIIFGDFF